MTKHGLEDQEVLLREATMHDRDTNLVLDKEELEIAAKTVKFIEGKIETPSSSSMEVNLQFLEEIRKFN